MDGMDSLLSADAIAQMAAAIAATVEKQEKERGPASRSRKGTPGKKRTRQEDTPLTRLIVYEVRDITAKTVYFVEGVGQTEKLVDELQDAGHELYGFTLSGSGQKYPNPLPYRAVISTTSRKVGWQKHWKPTARYNNFVHMGGDGHVAGLYQVESWPPGKNDGYRVSLVSGQPKESTFDPWPASQSGSSSGAEAIHLNEVVAKEPDKLIVTSWQNEHALLEAVERCLNVTMTDEAKQEAYRILQEGTTSWPPQPRELAHRRSVKALEDRLAQLESDNAKLQALAAQQSQVIAQQLRSLNEKLGWTAWDGSKPPF